MQKLPGFPDLRSGDFPENDIANKMLLNGKFLTRQLRTNPEAIFVWETKSKAKEMELFAEILGKLVIF